MTDPVPRKSHVPHWGWLLLATILLVVTFLGVRFVWPMSRQYKLVMDLNSRAKTTALKMTVTTEHLLPVWLRKRIGGNWPEAVGTVVSLDASGCEITEQDWREIAQLTSLRNLNANSRQVREFYISTKMVSVSDPRWRTAITDAELMYLKDLTNLEELQLTGAEITDAGLAHLLRLANLRVLWLNETQITDTGLAHLARMTNLRVLSLYRTETTSDGIAKLKAALPACRIIGP